MLTSRSVLYAPVVELDPASSDSSRRCDVQYGPEQFTEFIDVDHKVLVGEDAKLAARCVRQSQRLQVRQVLTDEQTAVLKRRVDSSC